LVYVASPGCGFLIFAQKTIFFMDPVHENLHRDEYVLILMFFITGNKSSFMLSLIVNMN
jgi:hypothetical protein